MVIKTGFSLGELFLGSDFFRCEIY